MLIKETFNVDTHIEKIYHFFLDAEKVGACLPGCESVEAVDENVYDSIIKAKVGTISAKFKVRTKIVETVPFTLIRTTGEGKELRNLGHFNQKTAITLKELSENETEVSYQAEVSIVGRLGSFGDRIMKSKAKTMGKEFADSVKHKLNDKQPSYEENPQHIESSDQKETGWMQPIKAFIQKIVQSLRRVFRLC